MKRLKKCLLQIGIAQRLLRYAALRGPHPGPKWLQRLRERVIERYFHVDPTLHRAAYRHFNAGAPDCKRNDAPALFDRAAELGYLGWPKRIRRWIAGRDVLDIGCGTGVHGIGFVIAGAKSYAGVDPRIRPERSRAKDMRSSKWVDFGWTGTEIMEQIPRIRLFSGGVEELDPDDRFDVAVLHQVTEHLLQLEDVLVAIADHLREEGELIFNHHNFYCWNGHHMAPKRLADIDPSDPEQRNFIDWAHLDFQAPEGHYFHRGLNKLRIHEVREITARHFDILEWTLIPSTAERGAERLTPEIRALHPELSEVEFLTQHVFCRAAPKRRSGLADAA